MGKDVCDVFGDTNYRRSLNCLDEYEKGVSQIDAPGGLQRMTVINESPGRLSENRGQKSGPGKPGMVTDHKSE